MKQIILRSDYQAAVDAVEPCLARLAFAWIAYGYLVWLVCRALPDGPLGRAAAWAVALLGGWALAAWTAGV